MIVLSQCENLAIWQFLTVAKKKSRQIIFKSDKIGNSWGMGEGEAGRGGLPLNKFHS